MKMKEIFKGVSVYVQTPEPRGIMVTGEEAERTIEQWEEQVETVTERAETIAEVLPDIEERVLELGREIKQESANLRRLKDMYKKVKTPVAKAKYARMLVYSKRTLDYLVESRPLLKLNAIRAKSSIEEASAIGRLLSLKIKDAECYYKLNGSIRLVGGALAVAEKLSSQTTEIEKDLEVSLEGIEDFVGNFDDTKKLLQEADEICK